MKKSIAISLLFLHLLSLYGHLALYEFFVYQSDRLFNEQISMNKYSLDDLVSVKVPVSMPTIQDWTDYQCISGQIKFKSNSYNYVKVKMTRDTLYLMCVPNYKKTILINKNIIDARKIADIPVNKKEHVPFGKMASLSAFNYQVVQYRFFSPISALNRAVFHIGSDIVTCCITSPAQPPEALNRIS